MQRKISQIHNQNKSLENFNNLLLVENSCSTKYVTMYVHTYVHTVPTNVSTKEPGKFSVTLI